MKPKYRALLLNFVGFAFLFVIARLLLGYFIPLNRIILAIMAAVAATALAPKFGVVKSAKGDKLMMKWIFIKGFREI